MRYFRRKLLAPISLSILGNIFQARSNIKLDVTRSKVQNANRIHPCVLFHLTWPSILTLNVIVIVVAQFYSLLVAFI